MYILTEIGMSGIARHVICFSRCGPCNLSKAKGQFLVIFPISSSRESGKLAIARSVVVAVSAAAALACCGCPVELNEHSGACCCCCVAVAVTFFSDISLILGPKDKVVDSPHHLFFIMTFSVRSNFEICVVHLVHHYHIY